MTARDVERAPAGDLGGRWTSVVRISNAKGLHARAAAAFVRTAEAYDAEISVTRRGETVDGACIMDLLMLAAGPGCHILIEAAGREAEDAARALNALVRDGFGERDPAPVEVTDG
ncbi:MAG: HPr family phosphocarrier protein [Pseudomonadota bacterium]